MIILSNRKIDPTDKKDFGHSAQNDQAPIDRCTISRHNLLSAVDNFVQTTPQNARLEPSLALVEGILDSLHRAAIANQSVCESNKFRKIHLTKKKISDLSRFILDNIERRIDLIDLAEVADLSPSYLCRVMKLETGLTPYNFVLRIRVDCARENLASTSLPLVEIALACGFSNQSHFCTAFKKFTGQTPGQYRRAAAASVYGFARPGFLEIQTLPLTRQVVCDR